VAEAARLYQAGDAAAAAALCREDLAENPLSRDALLLLGVAQMQQGELAEAGAALEAALAVDADCIDAHANLGTVRQLQGDTDGACAAFEAALALAPDRADIHYNHANALSAAGRWRDALQGYRQSIALDEGNPLFHFNLGVTHHHLAELDAAIAAYDRAIELAPDYVEALTNQGALFKELGRLEQAEARFQAAFELRPDDPALARNVRSLLQQQLPPWHWPMLADERRNSAFDEAIRRAVGPDDLVLDIGTGSGLLAMMAARAGAKQVIACEVSPSLAAAAAQVVRRNGLDSQVAIVNRKSTALSPGEDLPRAANVVVSEIVDAGLLGEGVLPTLRHALQELTAPGAAVIPCAATVQAALVEIPGMRRVNPVKQISGFDLSDFDRFRVPDEYQELRLRRVPHTLLTPC
jgi:tetratricopeptide (TPR) repeat protein